MSGNRPNGRRTAVRASPQRRDITDDDPAPCHTEGASTSTQTIHSLRIVRHVPAGEGEAEPWHLSLSTRQPASTRGHPPRRRQARPRGRRRRVPRPGRPVRLRQVHLAAHARRPRRGQRGQHLHRRPQRHRRAAEGPRHRDGVPELRAVPAHDRRREHGLRAQDRRRQQGGARRARARGGQAARPRAVPQPQAEGTLRRPASARRHGPRDRAPARRCSSWTSRCRTSTPSSACRPAPRSPRCSVASASPPSTSPTTRPRRSPWATASPC